MTVAPNVPAGTLDYGHRTNTRRFPLYYLIYTLLTLVPVALTLVNLVFVTPRFKSVFKDFSTNLPLLTSGLLSASDITRSGLWTIPLAFAFLFPMLPARITARQEPRVRRVSSVATYAVLMLLLVLAIALVSAVALYLPLVKLIQSVSGTP